MKASWHSLKIMEERFHPHSVGSLQVEGRGSRRGWIHEEGDHYRCRRWSLNDGAMVGGTRWQCDGMGWDLRDGENGDEDMETARGGF